MKLLDLCRRCSLFIGMKLLDLCRRYSLFIGMKLLDLCRRCSLVIANSRLHNDKHIGRTTCKDISTVYYLIMYPFLFQYVNEFTVYDFNPMFSDVHNGIHFTIETKVETREKHAKVDCDRKYVKWNQTNSQQFVNDLFSDENGRVKNLDEKLDVIVNNNDDDCIDDIVSDLQKIFVSTAKSTVGYMSNEQRSTHHNNNPWFDNTCKEKTDEFHIVSNRYRFDKSDRTKEELNLKAKALRGQMNSNVKKFQENNAPTFVRPQKIIQRKCGKY